MSQDTEVSCSVSPQSMGVWLLVAEGGRARDHSMTWASTQCHCSQYDTPEMQPVTQACSGPSQTTRLQAVPAWGEFNLAAPWRVDSWSPAASQPHFASSLLCSATTSPRNPLPEKQRGHLHCGTSGGLWPSPLLVPHNLAHPSLA